MNGVDRAIRSALAKGDATDPAFREKVYRSVFAALEKSIAVNKSLAPGDVDSRRKNLANLIREIERDFLQQKSEIGVHALDSASPTPEIDEKPSRPMPAPEVEPDERRRRPRAVSPEVPPASATRPARKRIFSRRPRPFAVIFVLALLIASGGIAAWWIRDSGILLSQVERDTGVPNPPRQLSEEDYQPDNGSSGALGEFTKPRRSWITVFNPDDISAVTASAGATAEITGSGRDKVLRIRSSSKEAAVTFNVGQGILERIAGSRAVFDIVAFAEEGKPTEMAVICDFGALGDCARKRYNVGSAPSEYLFEISLPGGKPDSGGTIAIVSDVSGGGMTLDIMEIRVAAGS